MGKSFVQGALILMVAATINRIIGFAYQAVIYRLIGPEGIGLFNLVYPVYILIIVVATAGIPLGISKLVSEAETKGNRQLSYQILSLSVCILLITGITFSIISYAISPLLLKYLFVNKMVYPIFLSLIPGVFVVSVSSAFRGFFQGLMNMTPPALGQIFEQVVRVFVGVFLATLLLPKGIQWAAVGIAAASILGELAGLSVMLFIFFKSKSGGYIEFGLPSRKISSEILHRLFTMCTPITLGRIITTILMAVDSVLIPVVLKKTGYTTTEATILYGQFTGVALTLLFIPSVITVSLATSLVPAISESVAQKRPYAVSSRTSKAIKITLLSGVPFIAAFLTIPSQITQTIYGSTQSGNLLGILAVGGIFVYIQQTTTGILQGLGFPEIPVKNMIYSSIFKIIGIYTFISQFQLGMTGCVYAYNLYFILSAVLNLLSLYQKTGFQIDIITNVIKPVIAGFMAGWLFIQTYNHLYLMTQNQSLSISLTLFIGFAAYLVLVILFGSLKTEDFNRLPKFRSLIRK